MSEHYYIQSFEVIGLWGHRNMHLDFDEKVNILIGPNASGKTTILNLLRYIITAEVLSLAEIEFDETIISLRGFEDNSTKTLRVRQTKKGLEFRISRSKFEIDLEPIPWRLIDIEPSVAWRHLVGRERYSMVTRQLRELKEHLDGLVPAVWLPVSRRLPVSEEEEMDFERKSHLESVDVRLNSLMRELVRYRLRLDKQLSEQYKNFERRVLREILYSKEYDQISSLSFGSAPTQEEKEHLIRAFEAAGLLDEQMRIRIDEHFEASREVLDRLSESRAENGTVPVDIKDIFIIPLIGRTVSIVKSAREIEEYREELFEPLKKYEEIVNSFLEEKTIKVEDNGDLTILAQPLDQKIDTHLLSSGEKQILILLTQALLWEDQPIVYVADEPELSLHVSWQEKLLESLLELGQQIQIIVATHSPDIVGPFHNRTIDLSKE